MKLALVVDDYLPHSTRVGAKMMHELARELVLQGNQVTVITPESGVSLHSFRSDSLDNVSIWRFQSGPLKDKAKVIRALNESLLSFKAWRVISKRVKKDSFDGIIYYSPSIFLGSLVEKLKKRCNCKSYLVLRDFFPQWAVDSGLIRKGSLIERYFRFFEAVTYKNADMIGVMSHRNLEIFNDGRGGGDKNKLTNHKNSVQSLLYSLYKRLQKHFFLRVTGAEGRLSRA